MADLTRGMRKPRPNPGQTPSPLQPAQREREREEREREGGEREREGGERERE